MASRGRRRRYRRPGAGTGLGRESAVRVRSPARPLLWGAALILLQVAQLPALSYLHVLAGDQDTTIQELGSHWYTGIGRNLVIADIDGDGQSDLLTDAGGDGGVVYLFPSRSSWPDLLDPAAPGTRQFLGADWDDGLSLAGVGDVNDDGLPDLVLLAREADGPNEARTSCGEGYILFGRSDWPATWDLAVDPPDVVIYGITGNELERMGLGEITGDDAADIFIRTDQHEVLVLFGRSSWPAVIDLRTDPPDVRITGRRFSYGVGPSWGPATGDLDSDGWPEMVFAARGGPFLMFGRPSWPTELDLSGGADLTFPNEGESRVAIGDVLGDAAPDLLLSDSGTADAHGRLRGYEGGPNFDGSVWQSEILGWKAGTEEWLPGSGDMNGDGADDILLSDHRGNGSRGRVEGAGEAYLLLGPLGRGTLDLAQTDPDLVVYGAEKDDHLAAVAVGDLNRDGSPDLAMAADDIYLFFGPDLRPTSPPPDLYVDKATGDDALDGQSWGRAKRNVSAALDVLDVSAGPAVVRVAAGEYRWRTTIGAETTLLGGYPSGGGSRNPRIFTSVLSGATFVAAGRGEVSRLDGFTITGGMAPFGAGIHVARGKAIITNNVLTGNSALAEIHCRNVRCWQGDPSDYSVYEDHWGSCTGMGAGVFVADGVTAEVTNNLMHGNDVVAWGGTCPNYRPGFGWTCEPPPPNCEDFFRGGAVFAESGASLTARNNTITGNTGLQLNGGMGVDLDDTPGEVTLENNILHGNDGPDLRMTPGSAGLRYNLIEETTDFLDPTNLRDDPLFVDAAGDDFRLSQTGSGQPRQSPAVDAGSVLASDLCFGYDAPFCLDGYTTRTDQVLDAGQVDLGFHYRKNLPPMFDGLGAASSVEGCAIRLTWRPGQEPETQQPITYNVYRAETPGAQDFGAPLVSVVEPATSFLDDTVLWGATYYYVVRAEDATGHEEQNSVELSATAEDTIPPAFPLFLPASAGGCDVLVEFSVTDDCSGVDGFDLHRSLTPGFTPDASTFLVGAPVSPYTDTVPANGIYYYRLVASDIAGNLANSHQVEARVDTCSGPVPVPGEAWIDRVLRDPAGLVFEIARAAGAEFHRLYEGDLTTLSAGYNHGASPTGPGICRFDLDIVLYPEGMFPGSFYFLVSGVNAEGEGTLGFDSTGQPDRDNTSGPRDCP